MWLIVDMDLSGSDLEETMCDEMWLSLDGYNNRLKTKAFAQ